MTLSENSRTEAVRNGSKRQQKEEISYSIEQDEGVSNSKIQGEQLSEDQGGQLSVVEGAQLSRDEGTELLPGKPLFENGKDSDSVHIEFVDSQKEDHGKYKWVVVFSCFIQHFITGGFERSDGVLYLKLINRFHGSAQATAWVGSLSSTVRLVLGPLASIVSNKYSSRFAVIVGGVVMALGVVISGFAPNLVFLYFSFGLIGGLGRALSYAPGLVTVGQYFAKRPGLAVGLATSGVGAGTFVIPPLFDFLFEEFDFLGAFLILGSIPLNLCVCGALYRPLELHRKIMAGDRLKKKIKNKEDYSAGNNGHLSSKMETSNLLERSSAYSDATKHRTVQTVEENSTTSEMVKQSTVPPIHKDSTSKMIPRPFHASQTSVTFEYTSFQHENPSFWAKLFKCCSSQNTRTKNENAPKLLELSLLKNPPFLLFCISICLFTLSFKSAFTFLPPLAKSRGCTEREAALLMSIAGIVDTIARILSGLILDLKRVRKFRPAIYNGVMFLIAALSFLAPSLNAFWSFAIMCGLYGAFTGAYVSQKSVIIVDILGAEKLTSSLGLMIFFQGIGTLIGPPLSGLLKDLFGDFTEAFYFGGACIVVAAVIMIFCNICLTTQRRKQLETKQSERKLS